MTVLTWSRCGLEPIAAGTSSSLISGDSTSGLLMRSAANWAGDVRAKLRLACALTFSTELLPIDLAIRY
jgi:hypothetical protein